MKAPPSQLEGVEAMWAQGIEKSFTNFAILTDKKCPFTGLVSIRGRILTGTVVSTKMHRTLIIRREYLHFIPKYSRYEKRHKNLAAHVSPAFRVEEGDQVTVGQCRPLSKTVRPPVASRIPERDPTSASDNIKATANNPTRSDSMFSASSPELARLLSSSTSSDRFFLGFIDMAAWGFVGCRSEWRVCDHMEFDESWHGKSALATETI
jgi:ribosomal protein uS17